MSESILGKREYVAAMALQGLLSNPEIFNLKDGESITKVEVAEGAIAIADALLEALEGEIAL